MQLDSHNIQLDSHIGWEFFSNLDYYGGDIMCIGEKETNELLENAEKSPFCVAVNTLGYLKHTVGSLKPEPYFSIKGGIWVRKCPPSRIPFIHSFNVEVGKHHLEKLLQEDDKSVTVYRKLVTPWTGYFICDHYFGNEFWTFCPEQSEYLCRNIHANDLLKHRNYHLIKEFDIIFVQFHFLSSFVESALPRLNTRIILFTSQCHLGGPQQPTLVTDLCLESDKIVLWISTNPIYENNPKYFAFPYGLLNNPTDINLYYDFLKSHIEGLENQKTAKLYNSPVGVHRHLPMNHIRRSCLALGSTSKNFLTRSEYYTQLLKSEFVISTTGDRDDCYRHYECIGLGAKPISNANQMHRAIFGDNMIYCDKDEILAILENPLKLDQYTSPDRNLVTVDYWKQKIYTRFRELLDQNQSCIQELPRFEGVIYRTALNWLDHIKIDYDKPINYLEIGCFYGANLISVERSYGRHDDSKLHCIDPWEDYEDYPEYKEQQSTTYAKFVQNIMATKKEDKFVVHRGYSNNIVPTFQDDYFDIIYIDGNHEPEYVMEDAVLAFRKLKKNGYIIFDDYGWGGPDLTQKGIDGFLSGYHKRIKFLGIKNTQCFIQRIK